MILKYSNQYEEYLHDESRHVGVADSISFPKGEADVIALVRTMARGCTITTQGARTGIVAGAVPSGGHVLNLSRMNGIGVVSSDKGSGEGSVTVQPGALLSEVQKAAELEGLFFPPDPTEATASIGGMVACNASGAMSFFYGPTRNWIRAIRVVLSDASVISLQRGVCFAEGRSFTLETEDGRTIEGCLPTYVQPNVKSAAGYYVAENMDMIDLFIGMEGTLGIITEIELRLIPRPTAVAGLTVFLPSEETATGFVRALRGEEVGGLPVVCTKPVAIEYFDSNSVDLLRRMKSEKSAFADIPSLKPHFHTAVYTEFHADSDEALEEAVMQVSDLMAAVGVSDDDTWYATNRRELEPLRAFRHAVPEAVNLLIGERKMKYPYLTKLGTDMSVLDEALDLVMSMYRIGLAESGLESVIFGHIGNNHVHVNILPNNMEEYESGKALYRAWADQVIAWGGSVSAEHGIGKAKSPLLKQMYGQSGIDQMRRLKALFDPGMMLNPGNLFEAGDP